MSRGGPGRVRWGSRRPAARGTCGRSDLRKIIVRITPPQNGPPRSSPPPPPPRSSQHSGHHSHVRHNMLARAARPSARRARTTPVPGERPFSPRNLCGERPFSNILVWRTRVFQDTSLENRRSPKGWARETPSSKGVGRRTAVLQKGVGWRTVVLHCGAGERRGGSGRGWCGAWDLRALNSSASGSGGKEWTEVYVRTC